MNMIQNLRNDDIDRDFKEIEHKISKQQIYGECSALGRKLAALASELNLTHIAATLRGLIQQVELSNSISSNNENSNLVQNPFQANARGRRAKRLKSFVETSTVKNKVENTKSRSRDTYTCGNCSNNRHNARSCVEPCRICNKSGHTYLNCSNKENV
ncbi:hypothetical protein C2G38_896155 [Gigaspora rosea]|uniref:CCHC-type domain-containing protein n=1 Tax=Gigaspora rosea TaxID=44941 RepID=A0A397VL03_9GLOM|nr:hypothetical protein C2G38_896155 [Gigaspora rosea]